MQYCRWVPHLPLSRHLDTIDHRQICLHFLTTSGPVLMSNTLLGTGWPNISTTDGSDTLEHNASPLNTTKHRCVWGIMHEFTTVNFPSHRSTNSGLPLLHLDTWFFIQLTLFSFGGINGFCTPHSEPLTHHHNKLFSQYPFHQCHLVLPARMCRPELLVSLMIQLTQHSFPRCACPVEGHRKPTHGHTTRLTHTCVLELRVLTNPSVMQRNWLSLKHRTHLRLFFCRLGSLSWYKISPSFGLLWHCLVPRSKPPTPYRTVGHSIWASKQFLETAPSHSFCLRRTFQSCFKFSSLRLICPLYIGSTNTKSTEPQINNLY